MVGLIGGAMRAASGRVRSKDDGRRRTMADPTAEFPGRRRPIMEPMPAPVTAPAMQAAPQQGGLIGGSYKSPQAQGWWDEMMADPFTALFAGRNGLDRKYAAQAAEDEARRMAPILAAMTPEQQLLYGANPEQFAEEMAKNYAPQNVNAGDSLIMRGDTSKPFFAPKVGFEGSSPYAQTYRDGGLTTTYGDQRPQSHAETTAANVAAETARHNRATESTARQRLEFDRTKPAGGALSEYQGLQFQFKLDELDRELAEKERLREASLSSIQENLALARRFSGPELQNKFNAVYGNVMNPTGKKDDMFNWSIAMDSNRADGMAILEQLGGAAFLDSIQAMKGTGSLSDAEGSRVTAAATRLMTVTMSDQEAAIAAQDFIQKLERYEKALKSDLENSRRSEQARRQQMNAMMGRGATGGGEDLTSYTTEQLQQMLAEAGGQ
jgi:hypothetical protein